jgi:hypothetical protein
MNETDGGYASMSSGLAGAQTMFESAQEQTFNGTGGVDLPGFVGPTGGSGRVIRLEVKPRPMGSAQGVFFGYGDPNKSGGQYLLGVQEGDVVISLTGTAYVRVASNMSADQWHEVMVVAAVNSGINDTIVFVDGKRITARRGNNQLAAPSTSQGIARLGSDLVNGRPFSGSIRGLRVYAYPLLTRIAAKPSAKIDQVPGFTGQIIVKGQSYVKGCSGCLTDPDSVPKSSISARPQDFGAKGDGVTDDTFAIQSAINMVASSGGGEVYIPAGTYIVDKLTTLPKDTPTQTPKYDPKAAVDARARKYLEEVVLNPQLYTNRRRQAALFMHGLKDIVFRCENAATTIIKKKAGDYTNQDYSTIDIRNSRDITFVNCGWDGNMQNLKESEQAHALNVLASDITGTPSMGIRVLGNIFRNVSGDGVRFVGSDVATIKDSIVARSTFDVSNRSGVGVQRGLDHIWFVENKFSNITDQYIDFEPTGGAESGAEPPSDILIADNDFAPTKTDTAIFSVGGLGSKAPSKRILVKNNVINGSVNIRNIEDSSFIDNRIDSSKAVFTVPTEADQYALIVNGYLKNVRFQGGSIYGRDRAAYVVSHGVGNPEFMVFDGVDFKATRGLEFHSARHIYVVNSHFTYVPFERTQLLGKNLSTRGIYFESEGPGYDMNDLEVSNNTFDGFQQAVVVNARSGNKIYDIRLQANEISGPADKVLLFKAGPVDGVIDTGNVIKK